MFSVYAGKAYNHSLLKFHWLWFSALRFGVIINYMPFLFSEYNDSFADQSLKEKHAESNVHILYQQYITLYNINK